MPARCEMISIGKENSNQAEFSRQAWLTINRLRRTIQQNALERERFRPMLKDR
jgi:hypothetical protein